MCHRKSERGQSLADAFTDPEEPTALLPTHRPDTEGRYLQFFARHE